MAQKCTLSELLKLKKSICLLQKYLCVRKFFWWKKECCCLPVVRWCGELLQTALAKDVCGFLTIASSWLCTKYNTFLMDHEVTQVECKMTSKNFRTRNQTPFFFILQVSVCSIQYKRDNTFMRWQLASSSKVNKSAWEN